MDLQGEETVSWVSFPVFAFQPTASAVFVSPSYSRPSAHLNRVDVVG